MAQMNAFGRFIGAPTDGSTWVGRGLPATRHRVTFDGPVWDARIIDGARVKVVTSDADHFVDCHSGAIVGTVWRRPPLRPQGMSQGLWQGLSEAIVSRVAMDRDGDGVARLRVRPCGTQTIDIDGRRLDTLPPHGSIIAMHLMNDQLVTCHADHHVALTMTDPDQPPSIVCTRLPGNDTALCAIMWRHFILLGTLHGRLIAIDWVDPTNPMTECVVHEDGPASPIRSLVLNEASGSSVTVLALDHSGALHRSRLAAARGGAALWQSAEVVMQGGGGVTAVQADQSHIVLGDADGRVGGVGNGMPALRSMDALGVGIEHIAMRGNWVAVIPQASREMYVYGFERQLQLASACIHDIEGGRRLGGGGTGGIPIVM